MCRVISRTAIGNISFCLLSVWILINYGYYKDKAILAALYILAIPICFYLGQRYSRNSKALLLGILCSSVYLAITGWLIYNNIYFHVREDALGMVGFIGQKNLFANWIACG